MDKLMKNCPCSNTTTQYFFHVLNNHINERLTFWAVTLADSEAYLFFLQSNSCLVSVRIVSFRHEIQISIKIRKMTDVKESNCNIIKTPFDPLTNPRPRRVTAWTYSGHCLLLAVAWRLVLAAEYTLASSDNILLLFTLSLALGQVTSSASDWSETLFSDWSGCPVWVPSSLYLLIQTCNSLGEIRAAPVTVSSFSRSWPSGCLSLCWALRQN